jgi:hypothetical protein
MRISMRSVLASLCLGLLAFPASASAFTLSYEAPGESIARGDALTFAIRTTAPDGTVTVRVSGSNTVGTDGLLTGPDGSWLDSPTAQALSDLQLWKVPSDSLLRQRPGRYYWQAYVKDAPAGPVQVLDVTLPSADRGHGKLYPKFGRRGSWTFAVSSANLPDSVSAARLKSIAATAATRWGLKEKGTSKRVAGVRDGHSVAGFSTDLPEGTLGLQTDYVRGGKVVERDLALRAGENWSAGPGYPGLDQVDLESVVVHELGHMAGNKKHTARCANSPMDEALGAGEWWRGARDQWFGQCGAQASSAGKPARRVVVVD